VDPQNKRDCYGIEVESGTKMSCILRASGKTLDVRSFLSTSSLTAEYVWHRGERDSTGRNKDSGFNVLVSDAGLNDLARQVKEASTFLRRNSAEIGRLRKRRGLTVFELHFGIEWRRHLAAQCDSVPAEFVELAGRLKLGLAITHYKLSVRR
jgi:hypothetical protein